ncbi:hypothetical protein G9A89_022291 [Geosiphon pyriformis]|nr:hypothetical protein G9A89_022291 [Geosiphon pyriformis]
MHSEANSALLEILPEEQEKLHEIISKYDLNDVYNANETALFFKMPPNATLATRSTSGTKYDKTHLLDIEQEFLQEVQVLIEHVNIDKLLAIDFINIDKFEPLFTYALENKIVDLINNKYSGNSNANEDLESENEDKPLSLLSTHQGKIALEDTLHYCEEQYSEKIDSDFFKTLRILIRNTVLKVQEEKKQLQIDSFFK